MFDAISAVVQSAINNTRPFDVFMTLGIGASSFLTLSQIGSARFGIMPMILSSSSRQTIGLSTPGALHAWNFFFSKAATPVVATVIASSISYLAASTQIPQSSSRAAAVGVAVKMDDHIRKMLYLTALVSIIPLPFTALSLLPRIKVLQSYIPKSAGITAADEAIIWNNIKGWNARHGIRVIIYASSMIMGIVTYSAAPSS